MSAVENRMHVITGCTAVGKTDYAMDFAGKNNGEIISCDSLLVYKHVDTGTAKPTEGERRGIKHHCMDLVDPCEKFDVSMFIDFARKAVTSIFSSGKTVVVVGGPGFYLQSFYNPVVDAIKIPGDVENFANEIYEAAGLDGIASMLVSANDGVCPQVDMKNPRRVMAALKRCLASGKTFDEVRMEFDSMNSPFAEYEKSTILLERGNGDLEFRIRKRAEKMVTSGLIDEVKFLLSNYESLGDSVKSAIGYRETMEWLKNPTAESNLIDEISRNTMKLVKKQKTWLRKYIPVDEKIFLP